MDKKKASNAREISVMTVSVAEELNALLGRRRMSASRLSREANIPRATLHKTLNAQRAIDVEDIYAICDFLGESCGDLVDRAEALTRKKLEQAKESNVTHVQFGQAERVSGLADTSLTAEDLIDDVGPVLTPEQIAALQGTHVVDSIPAAGEDPEDR